MTEQLRTDGGNGNGESTPSVVQSTHEITDGQSRSEAVVRAVAALTNTPVLELEPLYDVVDPARIDELFANTSDAVQAEFSFSYSGCDVTVTRAEVRVRRKDEEETRGDP